MNKYISQLSSSDQQAIKHQLITVLQSEGLSPTEIEEALEDALNSRLSDLSHIINIDPYL